MWWQRASLGTRMKRAVMLVCFVVWCGCDKPIATHEDAPVDDDAGNDDAPSGPGVARIGTSGTRLKQVAWQTADGARQLVGFYDTQRQEDCAVTPWDDGNTYCTPQSSPTQMLYTNSTCTAKIVGVPYSTPNPPAYVAEYIVTPVCGSTTDGTVRSVMHLYSLGPVVINILPLHYRSEITGACYPTQLTGTVFHQLGPEIARTALVAMVPEMRGSGPVAERWYATQDGMTSQYGAYDVALNEGCDPGRYGRAECTPVLNEMAAFHNDSGCTQPVFAAAPGCTPPAHVFAVDATTDQCPREPTTTNYQIGTAITVPPLFRNVTTCTSSAPVSGNTYYQMGPSVSAQPLTRTPDPTPGRRLQSIDYVGAEFTYRTDRFYDSVKQDDCYLGPYNGTIYCHLQGDLFDTLYTDSACTNPIDIVIVHHGGAACGPVLPPTKYAMSHGGGPRQTRLVGGVHVGTLYTGSPTTTCERVSLESNPADYTYYDAVIDVPLGELETAARVIDP